MGQYLHLHNPDWLQEPMEQGILNQSEICQIAFVELIEEAMQQEVDWPDSLTTALNKLFLHSLELTRQ